MGEIKGTTRVCGLIGNPVGHSISPVIHNTLADLCGIDMVYTTFKVEKGAVDTAVKGAYALDILGLNVTVPHKQEVIGTLESVDRWQKRLVRSIRWCARNTAIKAIIQIFWDWSANWKKNRWS